MSGVIEVGVEIEVLAGGVVRDDRRGPGVGPNEIYPNVFGVDVGVFEVE